MHADPEELPSQLVAISAEIPDSVGQLRLEVSGLPLDWREYPAPESLQNIGRDWAQGQQTDVLCVPSVIIPVEYNYLLNPLHPDFDAVVIHHPKPFSLDRRLWKVKRSVP